MDALYCDESPAFLFEMDATSTGNDCLLPSKKRKINELDAFFLPAPVMNVKKRYGSLLIVQETCSCLVTKNKRKCL